MFRIAGVSFDNRQEAVLQLTAGQELILLKEHNNPYDKYAVAIYTLNSVQLGYVPREINHHYQGGVYMATVEYVGQAPGTHLFGVRVGVMHGGAPVPLADLPPMQY
mmetsp:Transcript_20180/g.34724  ORF Transcript_20180/g.34724 Transcript_20180/m.34724 type:complete len:106 (-) Transcript_20180:548-865(-)